MEKVRSILPLLCIVVIAPVLFGQAVLSPPDGGTSPDGEIDSSLIAALTPPNTSAPFFILFKDKADLSAVSRIPARAARARAVVDALEAVAEARQAPVRALLQRDNVAFTSYWIQNTIYVHNGNLALARAIAARPEVARIVREPVFAIADTTTTANALTSSDWNIRNIRADQAWPESTGAGVVVATIDSGARYTHSTLVNQYRGNNGSTFIHTGNWSDPTGYCGAAPCDNVGHGTMVTGVMVGSDGGANQIGVAPGAKWIACKGCSSKLTCYGSHLLACGQWILDPLSDGSGSNQPDIVNNSWSAKGGDAWFLDMVQSWRAAGILPVFAAGNTGPACGSVGSPGDYAESFSVGATNSNDIIGSFSSRGPSVFGVTKPNLSAPGVNVRSADYRSDTLFYYGSGTSLAAPHVAGTVALMWSVAPALNGDLAATERLLQETATPLANSETCGGTAFQIPNNAYGYGRVDALAAVRAASPSAGPVAADDAYAVAEDGNLSVAAPGVLSNDSGSNLAAMLVGGPVHGVLTLNSNGSFTYTPKPNFSGADEFTYKAKNGTAESNLATVRITVTPVNDPPVAVDDTASTTKGVAINISVLANDTDFDQDTLTVTQAVASAGTAAINPDKTIRYTPPATAGTYTINYTVSDGTANDTGVVTITVTNRPPVAVDDVASTTTGVAININVLGNDTDPDQDVLTVTQAAASAGTAAINPDKTIRYTPPATAGTYTITYTISDGALTDTGLVTVTVGATNRPPVAVDDAASIATGVAININVLANDTDPDQDVLTVTQAAASAGTAAINPDKTIRYTPPATAGTYTITYTISDGALTDSGLVTVTVMAGGNQLPVAVNDSATVPAYPTSTRLAVLANDYDPDGTLAPSTLKVVVKPAKADVKVVRITATDYQLQYIPRMGQSGPDSFTYSVRDNRGATSNQATVSVTIQ